MGVCAIVEYPSEQLGWPQIMTVFAAITRLGYVMNAPQQIVSFSLANITCSTLDRALVGRPALTEITVSDFYHL